MAVLEVLDIAFGFHTRLYAAVSATLRKITLLT